MPKPNRKIKIDYVHPPIPIRKFDDVAYLEEAEDGPYGWGATRQEALYNLREQLYEE